MAASKCECGAPGGSQTCRDLFNDVALRVRALAWTGSLTTWRLMHDVYAVQHPVDHCPDYGALIVHLGGVCWAIEHSGSERGYRAIQAFADRGAWKKQPYPPAPGFPANFGAISVASLRDLDQPALLVNGVDRWARSVWKAWEPVHTIAREWVTQSGAT